MTFGLVDVGYSLPKGQAVKLIFFAPCCGVFLSYLFFTPCKHVVCCKVLKTKAKRLQMYIKGEVKQSVSI